MGIVLEPGSIVAGRYRLDRLLGQGGMGTVWAATHTVTRRQVAMKLIRDPIHERPELRRRFLREARAVATVLHPNVVEILDVFELDSDTPVMVMELLKGETLGRRLGREQRLSLAQSAGILLPTISAVGTAHARGIVHRDLKPDNIYLAETETGQTVKVLDFGIAKLSVAGAVEDTASATQTGSTLGTPCYMAPEQAVGDKDIDHRADVWALGVILYECLSGVRPIEGESVGQVVMHLMSTGIAPLERVTRGLPADVTSLVNRMLSRERARRPEDLREVRNVLGAHSEVVVRDFGAPGSDRVPEEADVPLELSGSSPARPRPSELATVAGGVPVDTAGPHAVPSRVRRPQRRTALFGLLALGGLLGMLAIFRIFSTPPKPPPDPNTSATSAVGQSAAADEPRATALAAPTPAQALPSETAAPTASAAPVASVSSVASPARGAPRAGRSRVVASAAPPAASVSTKPVGSDKAPSGTPAPTPQHRGGLAQKPPF